MPETEDSRGKKGMACVSVSQEHLTITLYTEKDVDGRKVHFLVERMLSL